MCLCFTEIGLVLTEVQSSLTLSLLRCILTEGNIRYDGLLTEKVNLDALRSNMTIIPQVVRRLASLAYSAVRADEYPAAGASQRDPPTEP